MINTFEEVHHFDAYFTELRRQTEQRLQEILPVQKPQLLYEPISYTMLAGGKRVRPILLMLASALVSGTTQTAISAGVAVEILHNFTLVHDDIMDSADMRRGRKTVHKQWNSNVAILSGDAMTALAIKELLNYSKNTFFPEIMRAFVQGFIDVCEGQALDLEYQDQEHIRVEQYIEMIEYKTAKLLEMSVEIGALVAGANESQQLALKKFARNLGLAFQIQDDVLDASAEQSTFGKTIGGDIREGKNTYLIIATKRKLAEQGSIEDIALVRKFSDERGLSGEDVFQLIEIFRRNGIFEEAEREVERLTKEAFAALEIFPCNRDREALEYFGAMLMDRKH